MTTPESHRSCKVEAQKYRAYNHCYLKKTNFTLEALVGQDTAVGTCLPEVSPGALRLEILFVGTGISGWYLALILTNECFQ